MKRVLTALILIPLVLVLVFLGPKELFVLVTAAVASLAAWEFLGLAQIAGAKPSRIPVLIAIVALFAGNLEFPEQTAAILGVLSLILLVYCTFASPVDRVLADATSSVFCLFYCGLTLVALCSLREETNGPSLVTFLLCVVWAGDIAALYIGRALGRHNLAPTLSPNKTWEGAIASIAGSVLAGLAVVYAGELLSARGNTILHITEPLWQSLLLAVILNIAAQVGDLLESAIKRGANVKDSGSMLPGHGGILDRIDALLLAAPVLWYILLLKDNLGLGRF